MPKKMMWVEWEDGADLTQSHKRPGHKSANTRNGNKASGQATLRDIEDDGYGSGLSGDLDSSYSYEDAWERRREELSGLLAETIHEVVPLLVELGIERARPHLDRWWTEEVRPAFRATREAFAKKDKARKSTADHAAAASVDAETEDLRLAVERAPERERFTMSVDEAHQRVLIAVIARAVSDEQFRLLLNADIEDAGAPHIANLSTRQFSLQEIEAQVAQVLEADPNFFEQFAQLVLGQVAVPTATLRSSADRLHPQELPRT